MDTVTLQVKSGKNMVHYFLHFTGNYSETCNVRYDDNVIYIM